MLYSSIEAASTTSHHIIYQFNKATPKAKKLEWGIECKCFKREKKVVQLQCLISLNPEIKRAQDAWLVMHMLQA